MYESPPQGSIQETCPGLRPKPPQRKPLTAKEQWLYFEDLLDLHTANYLDLTKMKKFRSALVFGVLGLNFLVQEIKMILFVLSSFSLKSGVFIWFSDQSFVM